MDREGAHGRERRPERGENIRRGARRVATPSNPRRPVCPRPPVRHHFLPISHSGSNPRTGSPALSFTSVAPGVSTRQHVAPGDPTRGSLVALPEFSVHCISLSVSFRYSCSLSVSVYLTIYRLSIFLYLAPVVLRRHRRRPATPFRPLQPSRGFAVGPAHPRASDFPLPPWTLISPFLPITRHLRSLSVAQGKQRRDACSRVRRSPETGSARTSGPASQRERLRVKKKGGGSPLVVPFVSRPVSCASLSAILFLLIPNVGRAPASRSTGPGKRDRSLSSRYGGGPALRRRPARLVPGGTERAREGARYRAPHRHSSRARE